MIEWVKRCDVCGEKLDKEYRYNESPTKKWDLRGYDICTRCAALIDEEIVAFRTKYGAHPVSIAGGGKHE